MVDQKNAATLARKHLDRRFDQVRAIDFTRPAKGWVRAIRDALGMTTRQFARRLGVAQSTAMDVEHAEASDSITLQRLRDAAQALDCQLVYALVPNDGLQSMLESRARCKAQEKLNHTHHSMTLENQGLQSDELNAELDRITRNLLEGKPSVIWQEDDG